MIVNPNEKNNDILSLYPVCNTGSVALATFTDGADDIPIKSCVVQITPAQEGSGDPSPDNVRPIAGWTGCTISHSGSDTTDPDTLTISWEPEAGAVYGGTLTLNEDGSADLVINWERFHLGALSWTKSGNRFDSGYLDRFVKWLDYLTVIADCYKCVPNMAGSSFNTDAKNYEMCFNNSAARSYLVVKDNRFTTANELKEYLNGHYAVARRASSTSYHFDTIGQLTTFLGANNFWADTGNVNLTYRADIPITIQNLKDAIVSLGGNV